MTVSLYSQNLIGGDLLTASYCSLLNITNTGVLNSCDIVDLVRSVDSRLVTESVSHLKALS